MPKLKLSIPKISNKLLNELANQVQPLVRDEHAHLRTIHPVDLRNQSYLWDPNFAGDPIPIEDLEVIGHFRCLHTYGYHGMFKPSVAEVLCQIPVSLMEGAAWFEIVEQPKTAEDLHLEEKALNEGFHVSTVAVYRWTAEKLARNQNRK